MQRFGERLGASLVYALALFMSASSAAVDLELTGFATLGYAISDQDSRYLRYIDKDGTLKSDSLVGVQAEAQFSPHWDATVQMVASAPRTRDDGFEGKIRWAFVGYRPNNEWLFRAGRVRPPFFLNTQNAEVGVTYDQVRLPQELYTLSPVYDIDGGTITKTWLLENAEINLDAYWGTSQIKFRLPFQRDTSQSVYISEKVSIPGLTLSYSTDSLLLRGGAVQSKIKLDQPIPQISSTTIPLPPPIGGTLYFPGASISQINLTVLTFGADWRTGDWRFTGEFSHRNYRDLSPDPDGQSGYVTVARQMDKWTPYLTHARVRTNSAVRRNYQAVDGTPVPLAAQLSAPFLPANLHQRLADGMLILDQNSTMLGASYSFSATSKLKFEWMHTKIGVASALVDGYVPNQSFNVLSLSYSVAF